MFKYLTAENTERNILFDTGGNGKILLQNMKVLAIIPLVNDLEVTFLKSALKPSRIKS